jgi:hypothetical protein
MFSNVLPSKTSARRCSGILGLVAVPHSTERAGGKRRTRGLYARWIHGILQMVWSSASQAWELLNGFEIRFDHTGMPSELGPQRHLRYADDAFGIEKDTNILQREQPHTTSTYDNRVQGHDSHMMLDFGVLATESSTSHLPRSDWWPHSDVHQNINHPPSQPFPSSTTSSHGSDSPFFLVPQDCMVEWNNETPSSYTIDDSDSTHYV